MLWVGHGAIYLKGSDGAEGALLSAAQGLRLLVETTQAPVGRTAPEGNVNWVNKRALEYLERLLTKSRLRME
jgi:hypothetical protein